MAEVGAPARRLRLRVTLGSDVLDVSDDGTNWKTVAKGVGAGVSTAIRFAPVQAKFVRITQTATTEGAPPWSMLRLRLYTPGK